MPQGTQNRQQILANILQPWKYLGEASCEATHTSTCSDLIWSTNEQKSSQPPAEALLLSDL